MIRQAGIGSFGFPIMSGVALGRRVDWFAKTEGMAQEKENQVAGSSRLLQLLIVNAYTNGGLTLEEKTETRRLIATLPETDKECWICGKGGNKAIVDTDVCRMHNYYALATRK